jgi:hypothetical protein
VGTGGRDRFPADGRVGERAGGGCGWCGEEVAAGAPPRSVGRPVRVTAAAVAGTLVAVGGLHAVWSRSPWPWPDRERFADAVVGVGPDGLPSAAACLGMAGLLGAGAYLVGARGAVVPHRGPRWLRAAGASGVAGALLLRGVAGPALFGSGRVPRSPRFVQLDRRVYAPLCVALGAGAAAVAAGGH